MNKNIYSGLVTSNNYFWSLFLNDKQGSDVPVLIYLRGELGLGSTLKAYNSFAPFIVDSDGNMIKNDKNSITNSFHLITIDFPCKFGFIQDAETVCTLYPILNF